MTKNTDYKICSEKITKRTNYYYYYYYYYYKKQ